jgi:sugar O-acyltransferase (sialic acid O-acetyltransferase NeuD family)
LEDISANWKIVVTTKPINIFGAKTPYAFEIIETCNRLGVAHSLIYNLGSEDIETKESPDFIVDYSKNCIVAPSSPHQRAKAVSAAKAAGILMFSSLTDPTSVIAGSVSIGCGTYINALVTVGAKTFIGCHSNLNRSSSISHDCWIGNYTSIGPGAVICGSSKIGHATLIGAGSVILPEIIVGDNCVIAAGSVVTRDVPSNSVVRGNPARIVYQNEEMPSLIECPKC